MKKVLLSIFITVSFLIVKAQATIENDNKYFIVLYTTGENWDTTKQVYEQLYFKDHSSHLSELRKTKRIDIGGRYSDTGIILLKAKNEEEAQLLITNDIAIKNNIFKVEIFSFDPFYTGCIE